MIGVQIGSVSEKGASAMRPEGAESNAGSEDGLHGKDNIVLLGQVAHIDYSIAHATESRVDAHLGGISNLLERHVAVESHHQHLALRIGKRHHQTTQVLVDLEAHHLVLDSAVTQVTTVEQIGTLVVSRQGVLHLLLTEVVDDEIVGYAGEPPRELAVLGIPALTYGHYGLDERLLEDIVGKVLVLHYVKDIGEHPVFVTLEQNVKRLVTIIGVSGDQFAVGELSQVLHCSYSFWDLSRDGFYRLIAG